MTCTCVLDRDAWQAHLSRGLGRPWLGHEAQAVPTYTPIAKLCPMHTSAPRALSLLVKFIAPVLDGRMIKSSELAHEALKLARELRLCTCVECIVCRAPVRCAACGVCTRHEGTHARGCEGCNAGEDHNGTSEASAPGGTVRPH